MVGAGSEGGAPFHDRWVVSAKAGLRMGTSFNSLGHKDSEISVLDPEEVRRVNGVAERYFSKEIREWEGKRVFYQSFDLVP